MTKKKERERPQKANTEHYTIIKAEDDCAVFSTKGFIENDGNIYSFFKPSIDSFLPV